MKELVPMDDYGIFADTKDTVWANSLIVAQTFGKRHDNVLADLRNLDCSEKFNLLNFQEITYRDDRGRKQPAVVMTRDGFTFLVMGYRGKKAAAFKEAYIERFNQMERFIKTLTTARQDFPLLTEHIRLLHDEPKPYHFSNECDLINTLVTGMKAKQFRVAHDIPKGQSIRPYLTEQQIDLLETLQKVDIGLLVAVPDYQQRKRHLEWYRDRFLGVGELGA